MFKYLSILISLTLGMHSVISAQIISSERRIEWTPGIPGGIPEINSPIVNILDYGADSSGVNNSRNAIVAAMNALPSSGGVVHMPAGTYRIGSKISIGKNKVVFRGDGNKTKLLMDFSGDSFEIITYMRGTWQNLISGFQKDSITVTVADGTKFIVGQFAEIEQENDPDIMYTDPEWNQSWSENSVGQLFEVESVDGNKVTFKLPIHFNFSSELNVRIRPQGFVKNVGFENFYIEKLKAGDHTFIFKNTAYCWIKNVESYHTRRSHVHNTS
ncbi:MAG: dockerin, partial [Mariniphaga sp.]|nr:dockerin [Mariniphaga sp.]